MLVWKDGIKEKPPAKQGRLDMSVPLPEDLEDYEHPTLPKIPQGVPFAFDTETTGLSPHDNDRIVGYSVSILGGDSFYVAFRHDGDDSNMDEQVALDYLKYIMELPNPKVMANANFDLRFVMAEGIVPKAPFYDVLLQERCINEYRSSYSLDALGELYTGDGKEEDLLYEWCHQTFGGKKGRAQAGNIWRAPIKLVEPYARVDAELTLKIYNEQAPLIKQLNVEEVVQLENDLIEPILHMTWRGIRMDEPKLRDLGEQLVKESKQLDKSLTDLVGRKVNVNAGRDIQRAFDELGVSYPTTEKGNPSFTADFLNNCEEPIAKAVSACRKNKKLMNSFIEGAYKKYVVGGRLYAGFNQIGAVTGRMCVHGDTLLDTSRGVFKIRDYIPNGTDTILTHRGRQQRILRKYVKGHDIMYKVTLEDGSCITCTKAHRIYTPSGWSHLVDLEQGDSIHVSSKDIQGRQTPTKKSSRVLLTDKQTHYERDSRAFQYDSTKHTVRSTEFSTEGCEGLRGGITHLPSKAVEQSYEGEVWQSPSQLQRGLCGWQRVYNGRETAVVYGSQRQQSFQAPCSDMRSTWTDGNTARVAYTPHRREQDQQLTRELSLVNRKGSQSNTWGTSRIKSIERVGKVRVYDIEVEGDHSYLAGGMFHHNSSSRPNLQQTPRDERFRELFIADEGETLVGIDYSQIEPRLALHYCSGETADDLKSRFNQTPESDFYAILMTSAPDVERQTMKMVLLAQLYGQGEASLALKLGDAVTGKRILNGFNSNFPFFRALATQVAGTARSRKYIKTVGGRRCNYQGADSTTIHKSPNRLIQGGAADIMKKAIVDLWKSGWCAEDKLGAPIAVVHDELIFSTSLKGDDLKEALVALETTMVEAYPLTCPLHAESNTGQSWWDIH